jgi:hypothetical protein
MLRRIAVALAGVGIAIIGYLIWTNAQPETENVAVTPTAEVVPPADARLLFIGNSYTEGNQLDQLAAQLAMELVPEWNAVFATRVSPGGYTIQQHARDVMNEDENPPLRQLLVTGDDETRAWNLVVIQGQSQIMGFNDNDRDKLALLNSVPDLYEPIRETGATTMLLLTWGYADGDPRNPGIYSSFLNMQRRLTNGYDGLARRLNETGGDVSVAPAGLGFQIVFQDDLQGGQNPLAANSRFRGLYAEDGSHPSLAGSYLAACILIEAYTGESVTQTDWTPAGLDAELAAYLREVADRAVFGTEFPNRRYPWSEEE